MWRRYLASAAIAAAAAVLRWGLRRGVRLTWHGVSIRERRGRGGRVQVVVEWGVGKGCGRPRAGGGRGHGKR